MDRIDEIEERYQERHQVGGVSFVSHTGPEPVRYATDDDNALFTGAYLAAASYRYAVRGGGDDLEAVRGAVAGLHMLTHVSGTPGVLARWAFPLEGAWGRIGYDPVKSLESPTNLYGQHIRSGRLYTNDGHAFLTKTTRDQLSGVLFGLTAAFVHVPDVRGDVREIIVALFMRLRQTGWSLVDHAGKTGTSAHKADAAQRLLVKALMAAAIGSSQRPSSWFFKLMPLTTAHYNRILTRTFSFNLNSMDAHSLWLLRDHHKEGAGVLRWIKRIDCFMAKDHNPHFEALMLAATGKPMTREAQGGLYSRIVSDPYPGFYSWQKDPDRWWPESTSTQIASKEGPGIDALLPYWIVEHSKRV